MGVQIRDRLHVGRDTPRYLVRGQKRCPGVKALQVSRGTNHASYRRAPKKKNSHTAVDEDEFSKSALQVANHALTYYQRGSSDPYRNFLNMLVPKEKLIKGLEAKEVPEVPEVNQDAEIG